jgi:hypothetical protein
MVLTRRKVSFSKKKTFVYAEKYSLKQKTLGAYKKHYHTEKHNIRPKKYIYVQKNVLLDRKEFPLHLRPILHTSYRQKSVFSDRETFSQTEKRSHRQKSVPTDKKHSHRQQSVPADKRAFLHTNCAFISHITLHFFYELYAFFSTL